MGRIIGIDYGTKNCGIAVTDPLQIIVNPLRAIHSSDLKEFLETYIEKEEVVKIVIGEPTHADGSHPDFFSEIVGLKRHLRKQYPTIKIILYDEALTSQEAKKLLAQSELNKKKRREKGRIDIMSAVLILQYYLGHIS